MDFIEVYVDCSLEAAESRDPKGLYKKARAGEIKNFTGIDDPYEEPRSPEIHLHSDKQSLEEEVKQILDVLRERGIIKVQDLLADKHHLQRQEADDLIAAYAFLRRLENRLQMQRDKQELMYRQEHLPPFLVFHHHPLQQQHRVVVVLLALTNC